MAELRLVGLTKRFPGGAGLAATDLVVGSGECVALLGPTGSGKSTLLRLVAGLERPDAGAVWVGSERVDGRPPHRRGVSLLPQRVALYPHLTVRGNLGSGSSRWWGRTPASPDSQPKVLPHHTTALAPLLDRYPHQLSGGQRQLVGLAKLLAQDRPVWLLDEPFTGLDPAGRDDFRHDLHLLQARAGATIVLVTHDPADAAALGRRIGTIRAGVLGPLDTVEGHRTRPGDRFAAVGLAGLSLLGGRVVGDGDSRRFTAAGGAATGLVTFTAPGAPPDNLTLGIRPADLQAVQPDSPAPPGVIRLVGWPVVSAEPVGSGWRLALARDGSRVGAWLAAGSPPPVGTRTDWQLPPDRCHWFHPDTGDRLGE